MPAIASGTQLDHYVIQELIARTMATSVYRAIDLNTSKLVAIKIPHPEVEGDQLFYGRFCRERTIGESLDHPGVVKVIAEDKTSAMYIATEWAEGQLLRKLLFDKRRLPEERAVKITLAIADALEYIHSRGVVHRDLKPENIMINEGDQIKLIDFGIAGQARARRLTFGKFSQVMGSPDYISPEQVKGKRGDARSDLFALGVILYEMLTVKTPFSGKDALAVINSRLVNSPTPPRKLVPEISPPLDAIVMRLLDRDPDHRYARAGELSWDLEHRDQLEIPARTGRRASRSRLLSMNPAVLYGALAMIPVVIFGLLLLAAHKGS